MKDEYDRITAEHYLTYRPPLHKVILESHFSENERFAIGLDIGAGAGHSTIALNRFCDEVIGIEPSLEMRQKAIGHPNVAYRDFDGQRFEFEDDTFDIFTLAGSLYYAKSQSLLDELIRTAKNNAIVFVYDFELLLEEVLAALGLKISEANFYDHQEDFSGLKGSELVELERGIDEIEVKIKASDLTHVLLSVKIFYCALVKSYGDENIFDKVVKLINDNAEAKTLKIKAKTYHAIYKIDK